MPMFSLIQLLWKSRQSETRWHCHRTAQLVLLYANVLGLPRRVRRQLFLAALFHDIGKLLFPPHLVSEVCLTPEDLILLQGHPSVGAVLLERLNMPEVADIVRQHHERVDSSGYPRGIKPSRLAQILSIADTVDAITWPRAYRPNPPGVVVARLVLREAQFDAGLVALLEKALAHPFR